MYSPGTQKVAKDPNSHSVSHPMEEFANGRCHMGGQGVHSEASTFASH
jgi:hypothetical protein